MFVLVAKNALNKKEDPGGYCFKLSMIDLKDPHFFSIPLPTPLAMDKTLANQMLSTMYKRVSGSS